MHKKVKELEKQLHVYVQQGAGLEKLAKLAIIEINKKIAQLENQNEAPMMQKFPTMVTLVIELWSKIEEFS